MNNIYWSTLFSQWLNNAFFLTLCIPGPIVALLLLQEVKKGRPLTGETVVRARSFLRIAMLQWVAFTFALPAVTWKIGLVMVLQQIIFYWHLILIPPASCSNQKQGTPQTKKCSCCQWLDNLLSKICRSPQKPITSGEEPKL